MNISGWYVEPANYEFPAGTTLLAGKIAIVCRDPVAFRVAYPGVSPLFGPYPGKLRNSGGVVRLLEGRPGQAPNFPDEHPLTIDSVAYRDGSGWPAAADGFGDSLELRHLSFDNDLPGSWRASTDPGGSPGVLNTINLKPVIE